MSELTWKLPFSEDLKSGLLELPNLEYGPVEDVGVLEESSISSLESLNAPEVVDEDVWTSLQSSEDDRLSTNLKSWETFYGVSLQEPRTAFLSEGGPLIYDAAIIKSAESASPALIESISGYVIQSEAILSSLTQLALGRESVLYRYDEQQSSFRPRKAFFRMSGHSLDTFDSFSASLIAHGNRVRDLQDYIAYTQRAPMTSQASVSLAGAFLPILASLEAQIGISSVEITTLLQLQAMMERPSQVVLCLSDVVSKSRGAQDDEELLSRMFSLVQDAEHAPPWLLSTLQGLLVAVSRPWLESVDAWVGLPQPGTSTFKPCFPSFVVAGQSGTAADTRIPVQNTEYELELTAIPPFISTDEALMVFETGRSLRLLERHQAGHPLTNHSGLLSDSSARLEWKFNWRDIEKTSTKAQEYESGLREALRDFHSDIPVTDQGRFPSSHAQKAKHDTANQAKQSPEAFLKASISAFEAPLPEPSLSTDSSETTNLNASSTFAPPLSLVPTLSFHPLISARSRLINRATLRLLFKTHRLRAHLSLLYRFTLFSDGVFTSRLSHALFSPQHLSTMHQPGSSRPAGLNLGHRSTWPPASSELRLALTGILTDVYFNCPNVHPSFSSSLSSMSRADLPGNLSFAIRPMTPSELDACSDPNALPALDFLRLQYTPPPPLDEVVTPSSLAKYDRIFTLLLRCHRMLAAVTQLSATNPLTPRFVRGARDPWARFRWEGYHFIASVCTWFFDSVTMHWHAFEAHLERFEQDAEDVDGAVGAGAAERKGGGGSIPHVRELHDRYLEQMLSSLLLQKRQGQAMALLEEVFGAVLRFSWLAGSGGSGSGGGGRGSTNSDEKSSGGISGEVGRQGKNQAESKELYATFKHKAVVFVDVCRGLSQAGMNPGDELDGKDAEDGWDGMAALAGRLEMGGFY